MLVGGTGLYLDAVLSGYRMVDTPSNEALREELADLSDEQKSAFRASVPLRRFAEPAEVAYAVRVLAAREASYITGSVLEVAGGL